MVHYALLVSGYSNRSAMLESAGLTLGLPGPESADSNPAAGAPPLCAWCVTVSKCVEFLNSKFFARGYHCLSNDPHTLSIGPSLP